MSSQEKSKWKHPGIRWKGQIDRALSPLMSPSKITHWSKLKEGLPRKVPSVSSICISSVSITFRRVHLSRCFFLIIPDPIRLVAPFRFFQLPPKPFEADERVNLEHQTLTEEKEKIKGAITRQLMLANFENAIKKSALLTSLNSPFR